MKSLYKANKQAYQNLKKLNPVEKTQVKKIVTGTTNAKRQLKFYYTTTNSTVTNTPTVLGVTQIQQGALDTNRVGDFASLCGKMEIRQRIRNNAAAAGTEQTLRMVVFQWKPSTQNYTPVAGDILLPGASTSIDVTSTYLHDQRQLYKILYDRTFTTVNGQPNTSLYQNIKINLKKARKRLQFYNTSTNGTNQIFVIYVSDATANYPDIVTEFKSYFRND